jgi:tetratricopeptide (TPR) repeat protein
MVAGQPQQALLTYEQLLREGQSESLKPDALLGQGKAHESMGNRSAALQRYAQIAQTYPESGLAAQGLYRAGRLLMSEEQYHKAQGYFETVVEQYPDAPIRYASQYQLGAALLNLRQPGPAINVLQQAQQTPDLHLAAQVQMMIGRAHSDAGDRQESINAYLRVAYLYPDEAELVKQALRQVARHYAALQKCSEATTVYSKLLKRVTNAQETQEIEREMAVSGCP